MTVQLPERTGLRVALFVVALAVVFGVAAGVGRLVGPDPVAAPGAHDHGGGSTGGVTQDGGHQHGSSDSNSSQSPVGSDGSSGVDGYRLSQLSTVIDAGTATITFQIIGPDQAPVTDYQVVHDKELHLIATRDDLSGFNHVHPTRDSAGVWSAQLQVTPGTWRFYADSQPAGSAAQVVLTGSFLVAGVANPVPLPPAATTAEVDGYTVTVEGALAVGEQSVQFTITRDGAGVTDLAPYLGAYAHVVILRAEDGAYSHVHPQPGAAGPTIETHIGFEHAGAHRAYIEFLHGGSLHRAEVTLEVS